MISTREFALDRRGADECLGDRAEVGKHGIAGIVDDSALMLFDSGADEIEVLAQPAVRTFFVLPGETGVASYIGVQDRGKLAGQTIFHAEVRFFELRRWENTIVGAEGWRTNGSYEASNGRSKGGFLHAVKARKWPIAVLR